MRKISYLMLTICLPLCVIMFSLRFVLSFKPLYSIDLKTLPEVEKTPSLYSVYKGEYNTIVEYIKNPNSKYLNLSYFKLSQNGRIHFREVQSLFNTISILLIISLIISIFLIIYCSINKNYKFLKYSSIILIIFGVISAASFTIDFNTAFTFMHKILFKNNFWLFDPDIDPVINILPESFFFHCGVLILVLISFASLIFMLLYSKYEGQKE